MHLLLIPMILAFAMESLLWKRNKLKPLVSLVGNACWRFVFVTSVFLVFFAINGTSVFYGLTWRIVGFTFLLHIFGVSVVMLYVKILQNMCVSIADPLQLFRIIPLTLLSWVIFGGSLSYWEITLVVLIFIFCAGLGFFQGRHENWLRKRCCAPALNGSAPSNAGNFKHGLLFLLLWTVCVVGMDLIINYMSYTGIHPITFSALRAVTFLGVAFAVFMIFKRGERVKSIWIALKNKKMMAIGAIFAVHSILFITMLLHIDNVGILTSIAVVGAVPIVVLCGTLIMKEKIKWYSYVFITLIVACVVALTLITT
ncbi:MAG: hypothetical protein FWE16_05865 [Firmicutes bacterium]|nr:hypothetical protein [Bacillota bacterium]